MLLFDTGKKLEKAFTQEQFDALVDVLEKREDKAATREELRETELRLLVEIEKVRGELKGEIQGVRTDMEKLRTELKGEIQGVRTELKADIHDVRTDMEKLKFDLVKWQIGISVGLGTFMLAGFGTLWFAMAKGFGWQGF